jgi:putative component of membrane protein insertase Oxa1/YidC/SpoIIIJ protein YidD
MVVLVCNPTFSGGIDRRMEVQNQYRQKCETISEKIN